jgi:hypothetical protein
MAGGGSWSANFEAYVENHLRKAIWKTQRNSRDTRMDMRDALTPNIWIS